MSRAREFFEQQAAIEYRDAPQKLKRTKSGWYADQRVQDQWESWRAAWHIAFAEGYLLGESAGRREGQEAAFNGICFADAGPA